jgi:homoserine kinase
LKRSVTVEAPASSANLGAGFDVFAMALDQPRDRLVLRRAKEGIRVSTSGARLPMSARDNVVGAVAGAIMKGEGVKEGVTLSLRKGVPIGAGLGSSAASSAAAAVGMNTLFSLHLPMMKLIDYAGVGEKLASDAAHLDNVAAALLGGFVIVSGARGFRTMPTPPSLRLCLVTPQVSLPARKTQFARALLPREVPLESMVSAVASASIMIHGLAQRNVSEFGASMTDGFVDSKRSVMIPGFDRVRKAALARGALGVCISGAGPTLLAASTKGDAATVAEAMVGAFEREGVKSSWFVTKVGKGCRAIE